MDPKHLTGKPVLMDKLNPELGGKVVKLVGEDMERAQRQAAERAEKKRAKRAAKAEKR